MILSHVKISPKLWEVLVKHTKPVDKCVRTTSIHFLIAFLVDGCVCVIRPLLEVKGKHNIILGPSTCYTCSFLFKLIVLTLIQVTLLLLY
jgi:hypothetical protein